jgi:hypothetical protein
LAGISDDATKKRYYAQLVEEENTRTAMALRAVVATHEVFCALYSGRANDSIHTPPAGEPWAPTQVERALAQLVGSDAIAVHSPQARGRKERLCRIMQGWWSQELLLA